MVARDPGVLDGAVGLHLAGLPGTVALEEVADRHADSALGDDGLRFLVGLEDAAAGDREQQRHGGRGARGGGRKLGAQGSLHEDVERLSSHASPPASPTGSRRRPIRSGPGPIGRAVAPARDRAARPGRQSAGRSRRWPAPPPRSAVADGCRKSERRRNCQVELQSRRRGPARRMAPPTAMNSIASRP